MTSEQQLAEQHQITADVQAQLGLAKETMTALNSKTSDAAVIHSAKVEQLLQQISNLQVEHGTLQALNRELQLQVVQVPELQAWVEQLLGESSALQGINKNLEKQVDEIPALLSNCMLQASVERMEDEETLLRSGTSAVQLREQLLETQARNTELVLETLELPAVEDALVMEQALSASLTKELACN